MLFDVSFEIKQGEIVLLVGSNGSGKSTLLKTIYGILPLWKNPDTNSFGFVDFMGENITGYPTSTLLKKGLLYIPQKNNLFEDLTVKKNLEMAGLTLHQKTLQQRKENVLSMFTALLPLMNRTPMKLSGGERQLLTLAMATLHKPKMILVDEPFTGLSPQNITNAAETLKTLNEKRGITILIVEHRVKESSRIANKVIGLKLGKILIKLKVNTTYNIADLNSVFV